MVLALILQHNQMVELVVQEAVVQAMLVDHLLMPSVVLEPITKVTMADTV